ncbi:MAG: amidohydrolase [Planctomycetota bacterium]
MPRMTNLANAVAAVVSTLAACCAAAFAGPDHIYYNANAYTMDADRPRASAIAIEDGRFIAVGSDAEVLPLADAGTELHDLGGRTVLPGLIDAHAHLAGLGQLETGVVDLAGTTSYAEVIERVRARAATTPDGAWIIGRGWDHESWPVRDGRRELPRHGELSAAAPDHPVWLSRVDGHAALANSAAMDAAGITADTSSPEGGEIIRDEGGLPTGVFVDNAESLVQRAIPASALPSPRETILAAQRMCFAVGLTGVHDMGVHPRTIELYRDMADAGELRLRIYALVSGPYAIRHFEQNDPLIGDVVTARGTKLYVDGAMGSRGAWLLEPYADRPTGPDGEPYAGLAVSDPSLIESVAAHALERGYQVCTHAIGDRANREVLDAYERAAASEDADLPTARFRIEHAQLLHPSDIDRFAAMGVIASMQPTHCTSDMRWIDARVGSERARGAYAWASLLRTGAVIAGGSDFPVESHNPFLGLYAAVTRQNLAGSPDGGWLPGERMTREEALRSMTLHAARAEFAEDRRGSIAPGKLADMIVIDTDVMTCEPRGIADARVLRTIVGGEVVFETAP